MPVKPTGIDPIPKPLCAIAYLMRHAKGAEAAAVFQAHVVEADGLGLVLGHLDEFR
jgi:hypothetical protein